MAFNPFSWFRKHQKVLFAGLTILVMFVFIGQFGSGDLFQQLLGRIGAGRSVGPTVATLYGKKVTESDLERQARRRKLASDFLITTVWDAHQRVIGDLLARELKTRETDNPLAGLRDIVQRAQQRAGFGMLLRREPVAITQQSITTDLRTLEGIATRDQVKDEPDYLNTLQRVATILGFQFWLADRPHVIQLMVFNRGLPPDNYFGASNQIDDQLDHIVWLQQADRLGITLTDEDVIKEVIREAAGHDLFDGKVSQFERERRVLDFLRNREYSNQTPADLLSALRDEFRASMAQGLIVGLEPGVRAYRSLLSATSSPAAATPDEFLDYYREQRTTLRTKLWTVPVTKYLDQVKETPSESELRTRFDRYRDQEPSPTSREPGFKEPRRITVEYVTASPDDPFYRDSARKAVQGLVQYADPKARAASCVAAPMISPLGAGPFARAVAILAPVFLDPLRMEYEQYLKNHHAWVYPESEDTFTLTDKLSKLHSSSVAQPANIASTVGSLSASAQGGGNPFSALATLYGTSAVHEVRGALRHSTALLLARSNPQNLLGTLALPWPFRPEVLPLSRLQPQLVAALEEKVAADRLRNNLNALREELTKTRANRKAAQEAIAKAVKEYHLKHFQMPEPRPLNVLAELLGRKTNKVDVKLSTLLDAVLSRNTRVRVSDFVGFLFSRTGTFEADLMEGTPYRRQEFLWWRSEDLPARTRPYSAVRDDVVAAWRLEKARQLARQEAERLEAEINAKKWSAADAERFLREQNLGEPFELDNVAQLIPPREALAVVRTQYTPYQVPEDKQEDMRYPPADLAKQLLEMKRPGEARVIVDQPGRHFYVAVLLARDEPSLKQFQDLMSRTPVQDSLHGRFMLARMEEYRKNVLGQLRREAGGKLDKEGRYDVPESIRKRDAGRPMDEE